ncbi:hypothetical protein KC726_05645 [Candidatus Woesebacteria bacterium]|nr:hypothetical protein [Candidatus Woesebacteria bacterium]
MEQDQPTNPERHRFNSHFTPLQGRLILGGEALNPDNTAVQNVVAEQLATHDEARTTRMFTAVSREDRQRFQETRGVDWNVAVWTQELVANVQRAQNFFQTDRGLQWQRNLQHLGIDVSNFDQTQAQRIYDTYIVPDNGIEQFIRTVGSHFDTVEELERNMEAFTWLGNMFGADAQELISQYIVARKKVEKQPSRFINELNLPCSDITTNQQRSQINMVTDREKELLTRCWEHREVVQTPPPREAQERALAIKIQTDAAQLSPNIRQQMETRVREDNQRDIVVDPQTGTIVDNRTQMQIHVEPSYLQDHTAVQAIEAGRLTEQGFIDWADKLLEEGISLSIAFVHKQNSGGDDEVKILLKQEDREQNGQTKKGVLLHDPRTGRSEWLESENQNRPTLEQFFATRGIRMENNQNQVRFTDIQTGQPAINNDVFNALGEYNNECLPAGHTLSSTIEADIRLALGGYDLSMTEPGLANFRGLLETPPTNPIDQKNAAGYVFHMALMRLLLSPRYHRRLGENRQTVLENLTRKYQEQFGVQLPTMQVLETIMSQENQN